MSATDGGAREVDLDRLLHDARSRLDSLRAATEHGHGRAGATGGPPADDAPPERGTGESLEGRIRVTASGGRLERIDLDARLMRTPPEELCEPITVAANLALDDLRDKAAAARSAAEPEPVVDQAALAERLEEIQAQGMRTMGMVTRGLADAMARIQQRTGMSGDPGPQGLEQLMQQTARTVESARTTAPGTGTQDVWGEGRDPSAQVTAVAVPGDLVHSVRIGPHTARTESHELAERTVAAINAALGDLHAKQAEAAAASLEDVARLSERLRQVQDMSVQQMGAYTGALRSMMSSIQGP